MHSLTHLLTSIGLPDLQKKPNIRIYHAIGTKFNMNKTEQTSIIGPHDSCSQVLLFLYNRLTLTVLAPYSTTLAYHDQNICNTNKTHG